MDNNRIEQHIKNLDKASLANLTTSAIKDTFLLAVISHLFTNDEVAQSIDNILSDEFKTGLMDHIRNQVKETEKDSAVVDAVVERTSPLLDAIFTKIKTDFVGMMDMLRVEEKDSDCES